MKSALPHWLVAGLFALGLLIGTGESAARDVVVDDDVVRLGDLFDGLSARRAATAVAKAPAPGQAVTVNPRWLARLAQSHGISGTPTDTLEPLTVIRLGTTMNADDLASIVRSAVIDHTGLETAEVRLESGTGPVTLVGGGTPDAEIQDIRFDATDGRFTGTLIVSMNGDEKARRSISGRAVVMVEVPVPARTLTSGSAIGPNDLTMVVMAADAVATNVLTEGDALVGKIADRSLRAGRPILQHEVSEPLMVERGKPVTMLFRQGGLVISARGRALVDGSAGEIIRVLNIDSGRTVETTVIAPDTVSLDPSRPTLPTTTAQIR